MLLDESRTSAPYLCIEYAASGQIYVAAAGLASIYPDGAIAYIAVSLINVLVDCEQGDFLQSQEFADAVVGLAVQLTAFGGMEADTEAALFELLFSIAAKLKLEPDYMNYWFKPCRRGQEAVTTGSADKLPSGSRDDEFPLFHLLLRNVLREQRVGEFARTGLVYILESTARSEALEHWVVESDLAAFMASGLGALYSQLGR